MTAPHKKLIEVALPLEAINAGNALEKNFPGGASAARAELPSWHRLPIVQVEDDNVDLTEL